MFELRREDANNNRRSMTHVPKRSYLSPDTFLNESRVFLNASASAWVPLIPSNSKPLFSHQARMANSLIWLSRINEFVHDDVDTAPARVLRECAERDLAPPDIVGSLIFSTTRPEATSDDVHSALTSLEALHWILQDDADRKLLVPLIDLLISDTVVDLQHLFSGEPAHSAADRVAALHTVTQDGICWLNPTNSSHISFLNAVVDGIEKSIFKSPGQLATLIGLLATTLSSDNDWQTFIWKHSKKRRLFRALVQHLSSSNALLAITSLDALAVLLVDDSTLGTTLFTGDNLTKTFELVLGMINSTVVKTGPLSRTIVLHLLSTLKSLVASSRVFAQFQTYPDLNRHTTGLLSLYKTVPAGSRPLYLNTLALLARTAPAQQVFIQTIEQDSEDTMLGTFIEWTFDEPRGLTLPILLSSLSELFQLVVQNNLHQAISVTCNRLVLAINTITPVAVSELNLWSTELVSTYLEWLIDLIPSTRNAHSILARLQFAQLAAFVPHVLEDVLAHKSVFPLPMHKLRVCAGLAASWILFLAAFSDSIEGADVERTTFLETEEAPTVLMAGLHCAHHDTVALVVAALGVSPFPSRQTLSKWLRRGFALAHRTDTPGFVSKWLSTATNAAQRAHINSTSSHSTQSHSTEKVQPQLQSAAQSPPTTHHHYEPASPAVKTRKMTSGSSPDSSPQHIGSLLDAMATLTTSHSVDDDLSLVLDAVKKRLHSRERQATALVKQLEHQLQQEYTKVTELQGLVRQRDHTISDQASLLDEYKKQIAAVTAEAHRLHAEKNAQSIQIEALQGEARQHTAALREIEAKYVTLKKEADKVPQLRFTLDQTRSQLEKEQQERAAANMDLQTARSAIQEQEQAKALLKESVKALEQRHADQSQQIETVVNALKTTEAMRDKYISDLSDAHMKIDLQSQMLAKQGNQLRDLQADCLDAKAEIADLEQAVQQKQTQLAELTRDLTTAKEDLQQCTGQNKQQQVELDALRQFQRAILAATQTMPQ
eukprot:m.151375 g.151375  ORF g.151375 m.151375 type:complete len:1000 (-) comp14249_c0_seq1:670-3669(-)